MAGELGVLCKPALSLVVPVGDFGSESVGDVGVDLGLVGVRSHPGCVPLSLFCLSPTDDRKNWAIHGVDDPTFHPKPSQKPVSDSPKMIISPPLVQPPPSNGSFLGFFKNAVTKVQNGIVGFSGF
ncbi:hypothetical protein FH972_005431 [Carpinus fangiana]|uniref:Uncharacterized protein n=1 Tax=Carpinus fangiana TaxID=176857 RepID=A0A5N6QS53_9ROSI|nr:hypothetical protein FH972_005431 [Carpinus fangiana]